MKQLLFLFICLTTIYGQPSLDSLLISMEGMADTAVVKKLNDLCWEYRSSNPRAAVGFGLAALNKIGDRSDSKYKSQVLNFLGVIYGNLGNLDSAYYYYQRGYELAKQKNNKQEIAFSLNNLGDYYFKKALYSIALENIMESFNVFEQINNREGMAYTLNDIGEVYLKQQDYVKALEYFERSGKIRLELGDKRGYAKSLFNIASIYKEQNKYEHALSTYFKSYDVSVEANYIKGESYVLGGLADLYFLQGKYLKSLESRYKALEIDKRIENKYGEIIGSNKLALVYMKLNALSKAEELLKKAMSEPQYTGHLDQLMVSYDYMTELSVAKKDFKAAYNWQEAFHTLKEQIYGQENLNKIADLQTAFISERKDRENERLKIDIEYQKNTRNLLILVSILVLAGIVLLILRFSSQKKANLMLKRLNASKDKLYSIVAHDLKNPLGALLNISDFLKTDYEKLNDSERKEIINHLYGASKNIHNQLTDLLLWAHSQKGEFGINKSAVNLSELIDSISSTYKLAAKNKNIILNVYADIDANFTGDKFIIETIVGNFIDNAIKFSPQNSEINITGIRKSDVIEISVEDHGRGIPSDILENLFKVDTKISTLGTNNEKGTGLGLKICKEFTDLYGGTIETQSEPGKGSKFMLKIPAH